MSSRQMVATETFRAVVNGFSDLFTAGETIVDEDHEVLREHSDKFEPVVREVERPEVEDASAAPGEKRGANIGGARAQSSGGGKTDRKS